MKKIIFSAIVMFFVVALVLYSGINDLPTEWSEYVVCYGDTICEISQSITSNDMDYRETEYYIKQKNDIANSMIYPGQTILVPVYE